MLQGFFREADELRISQVGEHLQDVIRIHIDGGGAFKRCKFVIPLPLLSTLFEKDIECWGKVK